MTDDELLSQALAIIDPGTTTVRALHRAGGLLLALPDQAEAARRALRLYQPQRVLARATAALLQISAGIGGHRALLPARRIIPSPSAVAPWSHGIEPGTCGIMLGSPEHLVRRAIASFRNGDNWEVAKVSFGEKGRDNLQGEARVLTRLGAIATGVPKLLGLHHSGEATVLRMPYQSGRRLHQGETAEALNLLERWIRNQPAKQIDTFVEWPAILSALSTQEMGSSIIERLSRESLSPVIRHGDFARWNLLHRKEGGLMALDWEWGHEEGMPGIDLAHYFLQDARLVKRLEPADAIQDALAALESPQCGNYLRQTGWKGDASLTIVTSLAFKQGAGHQENRTILEAACALLSR